MGEFFSTDGPIFNFLTKAADLLLLNLLWVICCIPIITAGASTTAMYYVALKIVKNEESYIIKSFFHSFKDNFKQATIIWVIELLVGAFLLLDIYACTQGTLPGGNVLVYAIGAIFVVYLMVCSYVYPVLARFQTSVKNILKNALYMAIGHLPYTVLIVLVAFGPVVLMALSPRVLLIGGFLYALCAGAFLAALNSLMFVRIFKKYMEPEVEIEEA